MISLRRLAAILALATSADVAAAHEAWLDPVAPQVEEGAPITADIRVGQRFDGAPYVYLPDRVRRLDIVQNGRATTVDARTGDLPAIDQVAPGAGLAVLVHVSTPARLVYDDMAVFEAFVTHKDAAWALEAHADRDLPAQGFAEAFSRHSKSLVAVGAGAGRDRATGLEIEIVAGANPYTDDLEGGFPVQVFYRDAPRDNAQVELFDRAPDGSVAVSLHRTDAEGRVRLPVTAGHRYLVDSVVLREPSAELAAAEDVVWESLWASLTFAVPE